MKKILFYIMLSFIISAGNVYAFSYTFEFSGTDENGTVSATMFVSTSSDNKTLTVKLDNTSPINLNGGLEGVNLPGITAFGFDLDPNKNQTDWELTAFYVSNGEVSSSTIKIGSQSGDGLPWTMGTSLAGVTRDFLPNSGADIFGAMFNPDSYLPADNEFPNQDLYFTTATLTMEFPDSLTDFLNPYVRMQNVGKDGEGSLKLFGENGNGGGGGGTPVPEPSTVLLLGIGLLGCGIYLRRKAHEN